MDADLIRAAWFPVDCTYTAGLTSEKMSAWMFPLYFNMNSWEIFLGPQGDPPRPNPCLFFFFSLCNSISLPVFLCLPKTQMLTFWQSLTVRHVCHWQTLLKDERREKERFFPPQMRIPRSRIFLFRWKTFFLSCLCLNWHIWLSSSENQ